MTNKTNEIVKAERNRRMYADIYLQGVKSGKLKPGTKAYKVARSNFIKYKRIAERVKNTPNWRR